MGGEEKNRAKKKTRIPLYDCINCSVYLISTLPPPSWRGCFRKTTCSFGEFIYNTIIYYL